MEQLNRNEIDNKYKWDLTPIFANVDEWSKELENVKKIIPRLSEFKGKITTTKENFKNFLELDELIERKVYRLYYYASLNFDSDTTNNDYQILKGKIDDLIQYYSTALTFVEPELLKTDYEIIESYINSDPELKKYHHNFESLFRVKGHELSKEQEDVMAYLTNVLGSPEEIYESLTNSDLKFGNIKNEKGEEVEFTESNWSIFSRSKDRRVRQDAFNMLFNTYSNYKNTIANTFSKNVDLLTNMAKLHKFNSSIESSLYKDAIDVSVYNNLVDTVNTRLKSNHNYYDLKKNVLGVDELHLYDVYTPLVSSFEKKYTFEEAKEIVLEALSPLGEDYIEMLNKAFNEKWIDVFNNKGKRGGAYSSGFYDINPYVLLNFEGNFEDVSTLAHELGHSMHSYLSFKNNEYCNSQYKIFVAEVASTVNELLLRLYMLNKSNDDNEKLFIIDSILELFRTTIFRQTMFAEFERDMHALKENGEILTQEVLSNNYYELNKKYFGSDVVVDDLIKYEWMRIPHFYYNFYVYKYVIGLSCATYIAQKIIKGDKEYVETYKKFLSAGGSDYPANELLIAGIDITQPDVINSAIDFFDEMINEFKKIKGSEEYGCDTKKRLL